MTLMAIRYVGSKAEKKDNVCYTGLVWSPQQVHLVPPSIGVQLVKYPDVWRHEIEFDSADLGVALEPDVSPKASKFAEEAEEPFDLPNMLRMSKDEIITLGKRKFGMDMDVAQPKEELMRQMQVMQNTSYGVNVLDKPATEVLRPDEIAELMASQKKYVGIKPRPHTAAELSAVGAAEMGEPEKPAVEAPAEAPVEAAAEAEASEDWASGDATPVAATPQPIPPTPREKKEDRARNIKARVSQGA